MDADEFIPSTGTAAVYYDTVYLCHCIMGRMCYFKVAIYESNPFSFRQFIAYDTRQFSARGAYTLYFWRLLSRLVCDSLIGRLSQGWENPDGANIDGATGPPCLFLTVCKIRRIQKRDFNSSSSD